MPLTVSRGAVREIVPLINAGLGIADALADASHALRVLYVRVVGTALLAVDNAVAPRDFDPAHPYVGADRMAIREMGIALWELFEREGLAIYTLNYDSLLMEALLDSRDGRVVYDGFPYGELAYPLAPWPNQLPLYPLHGTLGAYQTPDGSVRKTRMEDVRARRMLEGWRDGDFGPGLPAVVLGDAKRHSIRQEPFASYYEALSVDLERASSVVVGGYGFGDVPLNTRLARYLAADNQRLLQDWRPTATQAVDDVVAALRGALPAGSTLDEAQVLPVDVGLPSAEAVRALVGP
ncbi:SIR2 family protein [Egicoccus sp. AB-alg2]|uniref:SIR2 family protein n=1 Tax=Egicoccus sp. AB-alg2 TaxID=3242693 RepID=UPI00359E7595